MKKLFEKIKRDYSIAKEYKKNKKAWLMDYTKLKAWETKLRAREDFLDDYNSRLLFADSGIKRRIDRFEKSLDVENYVMNPYLLPITSIFLKNPVIMIYITKTKQLRIYLKKTQNGSFFHEGTEYFINPYYLRRWKGYNAGFWLENKLEQLDPSNIDKSPLSAKNFAKVFDDRLISKVFSPQEDRGKINWIMLAIIAVVIVLVLHFTGVIDLNQVFDQIKHFFMGGAPAPTPDQGGVAP